MDGGAGCLLNPSPVKSGSRTLAWWRKAAPFLFSRILGPPTRALVVVAPLTSQIRTLRGEVPLGKVRWLPKVSAVNVQGLASFDPGKLSRRLGTLTDEQKAAVKIALRDLLEI